MKIHPSSLETSSPTFLVVLEMVTDVNFIYTSKSKSHKQFLYLGSKCWNLLPQPLREAKCAKNFSTNYKNLLLKSIKTDASYNVNNSFDNLYKPKENLST